MVKNIEYTTRGTCSRQIKVQIEDGIIQSVQFVGGCNGNTKGIAQLVRGMKAEDVIEKLKGTDCGGQWHILSRPAFKSDRRGVKIR